jgi:UDP-2,3-diacylglucosamine pyrophosphatase LpxH
MMAKAGTRRRTKRRLDQVYAEARKEPIELTDSSQIVFFSDTHRGDNSWGDNFAPNQGLFFHALRYYHQQGFDYIEVGDGDELWHHADFNNIRRAHDHVFWLMREFHKERRLRMVWGNHDIQRRDPKVVQEQLFEYYNDREDSNEHLLHGIDVKEGLVLKHDETGDEIFVVHGHQGSKINDRYWRVGQLLVRYLWSRLQAFGIKDPTRTSQHPEQQFEVESHIKDWIKDKRNLMVICGHTHRTAYPNPGQLNYFNCGCCVHPRFITGIEIDKGEVSLVKWWLAPDNPVSKHGPLNVTREEIRGPLKLRDFFASGTITEAVQPVM